MDVVQSKGQGMAKIAFTASRIAAAKCPPEKTQSFMWDSGAPGLGLRTTPAGSPAYVFQGRYKDNTIRITIGAPSAWSITDAQAKARELQRLIDEGKDPRSLKREALAAAEINRTKELEQTEARKLKALAVKDVWALYVKERRPYWGDLHYKSHLEKASLGGEPSKRRGMTDRKTKPGPLASLMQLPLKDLDSNTIEAWAKKEGQDRPSSARLAWRLLTVFLNWCAEQPQYANALPPRNPAKTKRIRDALGKQGIKNDVLTSEQLSAWFTAVRNIQNPVISAAIQVMLLTGARPGEVLDLQWEDLNNKWNGLTIRDKVDGEREIPLTPYVAYLLATLPRRNKWIFSSTRTLALDEHNVKRRERKANRVGNKPHLSNVLETSASGRITKPNKQHSQACAVCRRGTEFFSASARPYFRQTCNAPRMDSRYFLGTLSPSFTTMPVTICRLSRSTPRVFFGLMVNPCFLTTSVTRGPASTTARPSTNDTIKSSLGIWFRDSDGNEKFKSSE
jgi:integrase